MIKVIKMISGEEVIGEVIENLDGKLTIKNPVTLGMVERNQIGLIQYMPYANLKDGFVIDPNKIIFTALVDPKLEEEYRAAFGKVIVPKPTLTLTT